MELLMGMVDGVRFVVHHSWWGGCCCASHISPLHITNTPPDDLVQCQCDVHQGYVVEGNVGCQKRTNGHKPFPLLAERVLVLLAICRDKHHHRGQRNKRKKHVGQRQGDGKGKMRSQGIFAGEVEADVEGQVEDDRHGVAQWTTLGTGSVAH